MAEEMNPEQFWKLYKKLPQELKDALFAEETGVNISEICQRNNILENFSQIVDLVGEVLLGLLPPEEFPVVLGKTILLEEETVKRITHEINRFIFFPVKESLADLYRLGPSISEKTVEPIAKKIPRPTISEESDIYQESIETDETEEPEKENLYREQIE